MIYVIGAITKSLKKNRVIIGAKITHIGQTLHINAIWIIRYLIIFSSRKPVCQMGYILCTICQWWEMTKGKRINMV